MSGPLPKLTQQPHSMTSLIAATWPGYSDAAAQLLRLKGPLPKPTKPIATNERGNDWVTKGTFANSARSPAPYRLH